MKKFSNRFLRAAVLAVLSTGLFSAAGHADAPRSEEYAVGAGDVL